MLKESVNLAMAVSIPIVVVAMLHFLYSQGVAGLKDAEEASATIRNIGIVIGGIAAILLGGWRSYTAQRQADAAQQQVVVATRQARAAVAQVLAIRRQLSEARLQSAVTMRDALDARFQSAAAMLAHKHEIVVLAGASALDHLARNHQELYLDTVILLLTNFALKRRQDDPEIVTTITGQDGDPDEEVNAPPDALYVEALVESLKKLSASSHDEG